MADIGAVGVETAVSVQVGVQVEVGTGVKSEVPKAVGVEEPVSGVAVSEGTLKVELLVAVGVPSGVSVEVKVACCVGGTGGLTGEVEYE